MSETTKPRLTQPTSTPTPTPTTNRGYFKSPEPEITGPCRKCGAENIGRKIYLWRVVDERPAHVDCDVCSYSDYVKDRNQ
jgi:hypothetical protein